MIRSILKQTTLALIFSCAAAPALSDTVYEKTLNAAAPTLDGGKGYVKAGGITTKLAKSWPAKEASGISYTVEASFKTAGAITDTQTVIQLSSKPCCGIVFRPSAGKNVITFTGNNEGKWKGYNYEKQKMDDGQWHRAALVIDAAAKKGYFYLDGKLVVRADNYVNVVDKGSSVWIGCGYSGGVKNFFKGEIGAVRITDRALKPAELLK